MCICRYLQVTLESRLFQAVLVDQGDPNEENTSATHHITRHIASHTRHTLRHTSHVTSHHIRHHTSHRITHHATHYVTHHTSRHTHVTHHTSHRITHTSHITSHITHKHHITHRVTHHILRHTSRHITRHTHVTHVTFLRSHVQIVCLFTAFFLCLLTDQQIEWNVGVLLEKPHKQFLFTGFANTSQQLFDMRPGCSLAARTKHDDCKDI